jgi:hypothetical protein
VRSTDQGGLFTEKSFTVTVTDVNESPTLVSAVRLSRIAGEGYARLAQDQFLLQAGVQYRFTARYPTNFTPTPPDNIPEYWGNGVAVQTTSESVSYRDGWTYYEAISTPQSTGTYELVLALWSDSLDVTDISVRPVAGGGEMVRNGSFTDGLRQWYTIGGQVQLVDVPLLSTAVSSLPESTSTLSRVKVADVRFVDDGTGTNAVSLTGADASSFEVDGTSVYLKAGVLLDREAKPSYSITISVSDSSITGGQSLTATFLLSVTNVNETPTDIALSSSSIAENAGANAVAGTLSTTDPDASNTFTYTLVSGTGSTDNASFNISGNQLRATASLNFEAKSSYSVRVRSTDQGSLTVDKLFVITVRNVNEAPTAVSLASIITTLPENTSTAAAVRIATISVTDDALGTNTLALSGPDSAKFQIVGNGLFIRAGQVLNFEAQSFYSVTVSASDASLPSSTLVTVGYGLTLTNLVEPAAAPRIAMPASFTVIEDVPTPFVIAGTPFTDSDSLLSKVVTVKLAAPAGSITAASANSVTVGGTATARTFTGSLANLNSYFKGVPGRIVYTPVLNSTLTRTLTATITEQYGTQSLSSTATMPITITPVNDAPTVFAPAAFTATEDTKANLSWPYTPAAFTDVDSGVLTVTLSVPDGTLTAAGTTTVSVTGTATQRVFKGSPSSLTAYFRTLGMIAYTPALNNTAARVLTTSVTDGASIQTATSTIAITPVNDAPLILQAATVAGVVSSGAVEMTYESLRVATGANDVETALPSLVIQSTVAGSLQRWTGTTWVAISTTSTSAVAQRTILPGQKIRWIPPVGATGIRPAFTLKASDGALSSAVTCTVSITLG